MKGKESDKRRKSDDGDRIKGGDPDKERTFQKLIKCFFPFSCRRRNITITKKKGVNYKKMGSKNSTQ